MLALGCTNKRIGDRFRLQPEVQKTGPSNLDRFAAVIEIQFVDHLRRELARVQLIALGQADERVGLVVSKFGLRARSNENARNICVRH